MTAKRGRPPKMKVEEMTDTNENPEGTLKMNRTVERVGTFIVLNTRNVKGMRINLDKIYNYAMNGETQIQISYGSISTTLTYDTKEQAMEVLHTLDDYCIV